MENLFKETVKEIFSYLNEKKAVFGFSGGVDSTTIAKVICSAMGEKVIGITINGGQLREGEIEEIKKNAEISGLKLKIIDAKKEFDEVMKNVTDAEEKRKQFKKVYTSILVGEAQKFGAEAVIQGTLKTDIEESEKSFVKSHHNVGLEMGGLLQFHPFKNLRKSQVRNVAEKMLPESVWKRHPFPGPGLFLRVIGVPATQDKLDIVRWADARVREILEKEGIYDQISQLIVAYLGIKTVGIKKGSRAYGDSIIVRAIESSDFLKVKGVHLSEEIQDEIEKILLEKEEIVRVWYDSTDKPPGTVEFE